MHGTIGGGTCRCRQTSFEKGHKVRVASTFTAPARPDWRLGSPFTHNNLTVFPVLADESTASADLITLDEGLRSGRVTITEFGADGRSHTSSA